MKKRLCALLLVTGLLFTMGIGWAGTVSAADFYYNVDDSVDNLTFLPNDEGVVDVISEDGNDVVRMKHNGANRDVGFPLLRIPLDTTQQYIALDFDMKMADASVYGFINVYGGADFSSRALSLRFEGLGFATNGQGGTTITAKCTAGQWHNMKLLINTTAEAEGQTYHIILDDTVILNNMPFLLPKAGNMPTRLAFDQRTPSDFLLDNFKMYTISEDAFKAAGMVKQAGSSMSKEAVDFTESFQTIDEEVWQINSGLWSAADGALTVDSPQNVSNTMALKKYNFSDFETDFAVLIDESSPSDAKAGILLRSQSPYQSYTDAGYLLYLDKKGKITLRDANTGFMIEGQTNAVAGKTANIHLSAKGDQFVVTVDGQEVINASNGQFTEGYISMMSSKAVARFGTLHISGMAYEVPSAEDLERYAGYSFSEEDLRVKGSGSGVSASVVETGLQHNMSPITTYQNLEKYVRFIVNGQHQTYSPQCKIIEGTTMVPIKEFFHALNADITVDSATGKILMDFQNGDQITLMLNSQMATKNGEIVMLNKMPELINNVAMFPVKCLEQLFDASVTWDGPYNGVRVSAPEFATVYEDNFESAEGQFASLLKDNIVEDGGNHVIKIEDELTPTLGMNYWTDYTISGRMKFVKRVIDPELYRSAFEVVTRRRAYENNIDTQATVPFIYHVGMDGKQDYLSISMAMSDNIERTGDDWVDFSITVNKNQSIFKIGDYTRTYDYNIELTGGFALRSSNCTVYVDDLKAETTDSNYYLEENITGLSAIIPEFPVSIYDTRKLGELTGVQAHYENGIDRYISKEMGMRWEVVSGGELVELFETDTVRFTEAAKPGDTVVLRAKYDGQTVDVTLRLTDGGMTKLEYLRDNMRKRQMNQMIGMRRGLDSSMNNDPDIFSPTKFNNMQNRPRMPLGKIMLEPKERNYDEYIKWAVDLCIHEVESFGHGMACSDFYQSQLLQLRSFLYGKANVSQETWDYLDNYLKSAEYPFRNSGVSENHQIVYLGNGMVVSELWPDNVMWNGKTGRENAALYKKDILDFLERRLRFGWVENDGMYMAISATALTFINGWVQDEEVRQMANSTLEVMLADFLNNSLDGFAFGAKSRVYSTIWLEGGTIALYTLLGNDLGTHQENFPSGMATITMLLCDWQPSDTLLSIASDRSKEYESRERHQAFQLPDDPGITESMKKYNYVTEDYGMGAINQFERVTGLVNLRKPSMLYEGINTWVPQGHQELPWSLYIGKTKDCIIFDSHPSKNSADVSGQHNYWTGDVACMDYRYFQNENVILGMHNVTVTTEAQFTHFYIPRNSFDEVVEEDGWVFLRKGDVYVGIKMLKNGTVTSEPQYTWTTNGTWANKEAIIDSPKTAFVLEVVDKDQYTQGFDQFREDLKGKKISYSTTDGHYIEYTGLNGKTMRLEYDGTMSYLDDHLIDWNSYPLYDTPYLQAEWGTGEIDVMYKGKGYHVSKDGKMTEFER